MNTAQKKEYEICLNGNFNPAYILECTTDAKAVKIAVKEAKANRNSRVDIFQNEELVKTIFISNALKNK